MPSDFHFPPFSVQASTITTPLKASWQRGDRKTEKKEEEGLLLILPSLLCIASSFLLRSILSRLPLFPAQLRHSLRHHLRVTLA